MDNYAVMFSNITSTQEASIVSYIAHHNQKIDNSYLDLLSFLRLNSELGTIDFISIQQFLRIGGFIKRYIEYPLVGVTSVTEIIELLESYIQKGYCVTHHLDNEIAYSFGETILILAINRDNNSVSYLRWNEDFTVSKHTIPWEEYFDGFVNIVRFDVFEFVNNDYRVNKEKINILKKKNKFSFRQAHNLVKKMSNKEVKQSIRVLCEWYFVLVKRLNLIEKKQESVFAFDGEFTKERLKLMLKQYIKICKDYL